MAREGIYVDSDSHVMEPEALWEEYTPAKYRALVPQAVERDGIYYMMIEGRVCDGLPIAAAGIPNGLNDLEKTRHTKWSELPSGAKEARARLAVLDEEGLTASVLYPTIGLLYAAIRSPEVAAVTCEAYNRWMADFCRADPKRLFGVATLPLQDVDAAVKEMERAAKLGLCGATIRPTPYNHRRLCDPSYDKFWSTAQNLNMPISVHGSFAVDTVESVCSERYPNSDLFFSHMICHPLEQEMASMDILAGGVLERFPRLKVSFLEAGAGWMMYWLDRLDGHYEKLGRFVPWLKHKPSELFRLNCYVAYDPDETTLPYVVAAGLADNILWGADYPHFDCLFPGALREIHEKLESVPSDVADRLLRQNPARFYNVDFGH
jgi:uncharacterized protein